MNTKTQAIVDTLRLGLPWAWVPVLFTWLVWTLVTTMDSSVHLLINFILSSLLAIMLTVCAVGVQALCVSGYRGVRDYYKDRVRQLEAEQHRENNT